MQHLGKRFYTIFVPRMMFKVPIKPGIDEFLFSMRQDQTKALIFFNQPDFFVMSPETNYCWIRKPLEVVDADIDYERPETNWPKLVRINPTEWLCFMGA